MSNAGNAAENDVFISYAKSDSEFASRLSLGLRKRGLKVWLDRESLQAGDSFSEAILSALSASRYCLIILSPSYFESAWSQSELMSARALTQNGLELNLVAILVHSVTFPAALRGYPYVDFRDDSEYRQSFDLLMEFLSPTLPVKVRSKSRKPKSDDVQIQTQSEGEVAELNRMLRETLAALKGKPDGPRSEATSEPEEAVQNNFCFIIMPFSVESLNVVYEDYVKPVLSDQCELHTERGDDVFGSNAIMEDITRSIRRADLIVADLTGRNPNVFYEVGIAHALNKRVLLMTQSIDDVPFDLRHRRALIYEYSPRGCKKLARDLLENVQDMIKTRDKG